MGFAVGQGESRDGSPGMGIPVGRGVAHEVREEDKTIGPRGNRFGHLIKQGVIGSPGAQTGP